MLRVFLVASLLTATAPAAALADELIIGCVEARSLEVAVPVLLRDAAMTRLGGDRPAGERIASMAMRIVATPEDSIESMSIERSGAFARIEPIFQNASSRGAGASYLVSFFEEDLPAARTDETVLLAHLIVKLRAWPSSTIQLRLDRDVSMLSNQAGTIAESWADESLDLRDGCISAERTSGVAPHPRQEKP